MGKTAASLVFVSIVSLVYFLLHLYVLGRFAAFFTLKRNLAFYLTILLLVSSLVLAIILESSFPNPITQLFYVLSVSWLGILFLFFSCLLVYELVRLVAAISPAKAGLAILGIVSCLTVYGILNALSFRVKQVDIPLPVDRELGIVQISDAHLGPVRNTRYLEKLVEKTNSLRPDLVIITGDLFDSTEPFEERMISSLNQIQAPVFFVTGNHEAYDEANKALELLARTKVRVLRNQVQRFEGIQIIGIDYSSDPTHLEKMLPTMAINKSEPSLLLYHAPVRLETLKKLGINLQLAGHTHNG